MKKKYKLTKEKKQIGNITLYRIKALRSFGDVKKGELGGWIESKSNLSHSGDAWIYGNAKVSGDAKISGNAKVFQEQRITTGFITKSLKDLRYSIIAQLGIIPQNKFILYKKVNKLKKGVYCSCYDENFKYYDGKVVKVKDYDKSNKNCAKGIHLSNPLYWGNGDTLIACEVNFKDIITCQEGKIRVKKCKVIGEVKI